MSVCSPSRISLMTGQTSARHRTTNWINPDQDNRGRFGPPGWNWSGMTADQPSLPRLLQAAGYRTIQCGKAHFGPRDSAGSDPRNLGFDLSIGGSAMGQPGSYFAAEQFGNRPDGPAPRGVPGFGKYHGQPLFLTEAESLETRAALSAAVAGQRPFFALLAHYAVHAPFQQDPRFANHYTHEAEPFSAFASLVEGVDQSLGEILDHIEQLGVAGNTLVLFLGDNGSDAPLGPDLAVACAAPLRGKKGTHYEGGMRTALLAAWAKPDPANPLQKRFPIATGATCTQLAAVYDLFPTILAATGCSDRIPAGYPVDGLNLMPVLAEPSAPGQPRGFLMHFPHEHRSSYFTVFRREHWKLVYHWRKPAGKRLELFDLQQDPAEQNNLAASQPEQLDSMWAGMIEALQATAALPPLADDGSALIPSPD